jgi:hypothetical protein
VIPNQTSQAPELAPEASLDPEQKTVTKSHDDDPDQIWRFRHSPQLRLYWLDHLPLWEMNYRKVQRFQTCGSDAFMEWSPSLGEYRLRANHCGNRICPACQRAYAARVAKRLNLLFCHSRRQPPALLTLTLKPTKAPLPDIVRNLKAFFRRLRATPMWRAAVQYGVAIVEVTRGKYGTHWHAHLHCVIWSRWLAQTQISNIWRKITCGSFVVDIRRVKDSAEVCDYVSTYLTKPPPQAVTQQDELAQEWYHAVTAQHWVIRFGSRKLLPPRVEEPKARDWQIVCSLQTLLRIAADRPLKEAADYYRRHKRATQLQELTNYVLDTC